MPDPLILSTGQVLRGRNATYRLLNALHAPTVYKAQVLESSIIRAEFAVVKTAVESTKKALRRERNNYLIPGIRSSQYIRSHWDILDAFSSDDRAQADETVTAPPGMVFEWMEYDLWQVSSERYRQDSILPKVIARSVLSALALLKTQYDAIHTDINPNNIFLSDIDGPSPVVKVGDLGNMFGDGYDVMRLQSLECRAPEVWRGLGVWHSSDVWSFGVTLTHWLSHSAIFGPHDKIVQDLTEAWCIAKIRRLVGSMKAPVDPRYEDEFALAEYLETSSFRHQDDSSERPFMSVGTLREELEKLSAPKVSPELLDFIEFLLVLEHTKRPSAVEALQHPYLR